MTASDPKADLHRYLQDAREALLWKLDGLSEYDVRRPLVPTGTNLLGLVKHVASVEFGYFGDCFGRPYDERLPWLASDAEPNADMWAAPGESREQITGLYRRAWAHSDATIEALPLDALGQVPWWPADRNPVTLHRILIHMIAETDRHAGQADIVRELIDGAVGLRADNANMAPGGAAWWADYRDRLEQDRKSTRLNSSHLVISDAAFCLKKKNNRAARIPNSGCRENCRGYRPEQTACPEARLPLRPGRDARTPRAPQPLGTYGDHRR